MKIEKVHPAGWKMETNNGIYYFGEYGQFGCYCNDGVVYKDQKAFENGKGVCYVPEYGFDNSDENGGAFFDFLTKYRMASELEGNTYVTQSGYTRADLEELCDGTKYDAEDLFDHLDWMFPETLLDEWVREEEDEE
jgi:hypothetical protein